jgi:hypothetical protein
VRPRAHRRCTRARTRMRRRSAARRERPPVAVAVGPSPRARTSSSSRRRPARRRAGRQAWVCAVGVQRGRAPSTDSRRTPGSAAEPSARPAGPTGLPAPTTIGAVGPGAVSRRWADEVCARVHKAYSQMHKRVLVRRATRAERGCRRLPSGAARLPQSTPVSR